MSIRWRRLRNRQADRLLEGQPDDSPVSHALVAAREPGSAAELAREDATVAMFHRARLESGQTSGSPGHRRTLLKALAAALGVAVFATTGVALASGGHVPWSGPDRTTPRNTASLPAATPTGNATGNTDPADDRGEPGSGTTDPSTEPATPGSLRGQCRAYFATHKSGKASRGGPFAALIEASGGVDGVEDYCANLGVLDQPGKSEHPNKPSHPTKPSHPKKPHPSKPGHPGKPEHPSKPQHPDKPTHPAKPGAGKAHS